MAGRGRGDGDEEDMNFAYENPLFGATDGKVAGLVKSMEQGDDKGPVSSPEATKEKKRQRVSASQGDSNTEMATTASSEQGVRRAQ